MKTACPRNNGDRESRTTWFVRNLRIVQESPGLLLVWMLVIGAVVCLMASPMALDAGVAASRRGSGGRMCVKLVLRGDVTQGQEWQAAIGNGWVFRVLPIASPDVRSTAVNGSDTGKATEATYSGWDLVIDREKGIGYPDALLLATPPYGSVNQREIGTTFGMRAQDAIAWEPRKFHFFTRMSNVQQARTFYSKLFPVHPTNAGTNITAETKSPETRDASAALMNLISDDPKLGFGSFSILDARIVSGAGDPPSFAQAWSPHLGQVPHTLEQAPAQNAQPAGIRAQTASDRAGVLRWIRFSAALWLPIGWRAPSELSPETANCAE